MALRARRTEPPPSIFLPVITFLIALCTSLAAADTSPSAEAPLADAAEQAEWAQVRSLLDQQADPNAHQVDGMTALHWAAWRDEPETALQLIERGADVAAKNRYGVTPLSLACSNGNAALVERLLKAGADANTSLPGGETALMTAARTGRINAVRALLTHDADVNATERSGQTAIMWAAAEGHADVVSLLIECGADFRTPLKSGFTPLFFAVREGRSEVVQVLLAAGGDVNAVMRPDVKGDRIARRGTSPLLLAVENGHFELVVRLLVAGADPNDQRSGFTALHAISWVRKPNRGDGVDGDPPPIGSGRLTSLQCVQALVDHGAAVNARLKRGRSGTGRLNHAGATPFLFAAETADVPLLQLLLELGADPTIPNADGCPPLLAAAGIGTLAPGEEAGTQDEALQAVRLLLEQGADVNAVDDNGETAMHGAAYKSLPKMVELLAESGADINVWNRKNRYGWTPLLIAEGHRPGNFKPAAETIAALHRVMRAAGIEPPAGPSSPVPRKRDEYARAPAADAAARPNVLLISIDDLNDWVGPLAGHPQAKTPNIDRLARRGVVFTNAHCNVPICSPSRTSLMTGVQPFRTGVYTNGESIFDLGGRFATLPQHFASAGYRTLGAGKLFHGSGGRYAEFFDEYGPGSGNQGGPFTREDLDTQKQNPVHVVDRGPGRLKATLPLNRMPDDRRRPGESRNNTFDWGPVAVADAEMPDGQVAAWAAKQLERNFQQPFFLGVGFYRPHQPLHAPPRYFEMFPAVPAILPPVRSDDLDDLPPYARRLALLPLTAGRHASVVQHEQWHAAVAAYLACVRFVDELVGQVLDALDASPHAANTVIVLFSDHGYHLGEKQHWGKFTTWEESTRVPLIVVPPRAAASRDFAAGMSCSQPVSLIDVYPTLADVCGLEPPAHPPDGESLRAWLVRPQTPRERPAITTVGRGTHSIRSATHRYTRYFDGSEELYDLERDPHEWHNLADDPQSAGLKQTLAEFVPANEDVAHFVRFGDWKAVFFRDEGRPPLLFELTAGTGSGGGIGESRSVASQHPGLVRRIREALAAHQIASQRVVLADESRKTAAP